MSYLVQGLVSWVVKVWWKQTKQICMQLRTLPLKYFPPNIVFWLGFTSYFHLSPVGLSDTFPWKYRILHAWCTDIHATPSVIFIYIVLLLLGMPTNIHTSLTASFTFYSHIVDMWITSVGIIGVTVLGIGSHRKHKAESFSRSFIFPLLLI